MYCEFNWRTIRAREVLAVKSAYFRAQSVPRVFFRAKPNNPGENFP